mmetsp:Transcript_18751/g.44943  ORF Transcript_18751/g.44943 Transcript_18751/m.44943 type:complete len:81 (+) Transcript_18751:574-816(+)
MRTAKAHIDWVHAQQGNKTTCPGARGRDKRVTWTLRGVPDNCVSSTTFISMKTRLEAFHRDESDPPARGPLGKEGEGGTS